MKMTRIALAIAATAVVSTPALATNGDSLIGLGAHSRAMGGTGAAMFMGSENALTNPGLLGKSKGTEFAIGGTLFKPAVKDKSTTAGATSPTSANDTNIIPEVSLSTRLDKNLTFGLGIFGSAGMGVDYQDDNKLFNAYSNLQLMKFAPTLAYNTSKFGIGFAPVLQYGALDINYKNTSGTVGNGMSSDLGMGFNLGGYFDLAKNLTLGLSYQSAIDMKYKNQITTASKGFALTGFTDHLEQPAELKAGVAYGMGNYTITADAKQIAWGSAKGYKDFNWKDQNVFALGMKYAGQGYWLGAGANYGDDPIKKLNDSSYSNQAVNMFNNVFFPGIVTTHVTFGGGYKLTKNMALDGSVVYAPEVNKTINTGFISKTTATGTTQKTTHSQIGYTVSLRMNF
ncbi:OmpP1/FadL family transporter [Hydrogenovibrio kuenenii]|uniref:OmpP1/FadL family transporter n=1 Tax=Hydrogenovibrio kuenenii TaxID=63658 RepID=UPI000466868E|nr:outer membrane protein transport protein [Hydrogenovibrio kuenenii]